MSVRPDQSISDSRLSVYPDIEFDQTGFRLPGEESTRILWNDIVRVAICYEIHPVAIADWDYWAFQTRDPNLLVWVEINDSTQSGGFSREIENRFGKTDAAPMTGWLDSDQNVRTYVIWPETDLGKSLYSFKKKHKWSLKGRLVHAQG
ncbi:MAG TPA: hypothetical protein VE262_08385 [Blastocatellia bacterium]|nr:hypothetical protein [Blastocatellia bacterium]